MLELRVYARPGYEGFRFDVYFSSQACASDIFI